MKSERIINLIHTSIETMFFGFVKDDSYILYNNYCVVFIYDDMYCLAVNKRKMNKEECLSFREDLLKQGYTKLSKKDNVKYSKQAENIVVSFLRKEVLDKPLYIAYF